MRARERIESENRRKERMKGGRREREHVGGLRDVEHVGNWVVFRCFVRVFLHHLLTVKCRDLEERTSTKKKKSEERKKEKQVVLEKKDFQGK